MQLFKNNEEPRERRRKNNEQSRVSSRSKRRRLRGGWSGCIRTYRDRLYTQLPGEITTRRRAAFPGGEMSQEPQGSETVAGAADAATASVKSS